MMNKSYLTILVAGALACSASAYAWYPKDKVLDVTKTEVVLNKTGHLPGKAGYVGSEQCGECHQAEYDVWKQGVHANPLRDIDTVSVKEMPPKWQGVFTHQDDSRPTVSIELVKQGEGEYYQILRDSKDPTNTIKLKVHRAGRASPQQYFYSLVDGDYVWMPLAFDWSRNIFVISDPHEWWNPDGSLKDKVGFSSVSFDMWCAACHFTGLEYRNDDKGEFRAYYNEMVVGCERCHGAGEQHIESGEASAITNPSKLSMEHQNQLCGQCHARGTTKPHGLAMYPVRDDSFKVYEPGDDLADYYDFTGWSQPQYWDNVDKRIPIQQKQSYLDMLNSKHNGMMVCSDCHNPHAIAYGTGDAGYVAPVSDNSVCLSCHQSDQQFADQAAINAHTKHQPVNGKAMTCISCHMPKTAYAREYNDHRAHTFEIITPMDTLSRHQINASAKPVAKAKAKDENASALYATIETDGSKPSYCSDFNNKYWTLPTCKPWQPLPNSCSACHGEWLQDEAGMKAGVKAYQSKFAK